MPKIVSGSTSELDWSFIVFLALDRVVDRCAPKLRNPPEVGWDVIGPVPTSTRRVTSRAASGAAMKREMSQKPRSAGRRRGMRRAIRGAIPGRRRQRSPPSIHERRRDPGVEDEPTEALPRYAAGSWRR